MFEKPSFAVEKAEDKKPENIEPRILGREGDPLWDSEHRQNYLAQGLEFTVGIHAKKPDTIVFLDTSARPLAGFIRAIWRRAYPDEQPPAMKFLNFHASRQPASPEKIRDAFSSAEGDFSGKTVMIVDEYVSGGNNLRESEDGLTRAFPKAKFLRGIFDGVRDPDLLRHFGRAVDVPPPQRAFARRTSQGHSFEGLGILINGEGHARVGSKEVDEVPGEALVRRREGTKASETLSAKLREIGQKEMLGNSFLDDLRAEKVADTDDLGQDLQRIAERFKAPPKPEAEK